jgi:translation initiation factor 3 subunit M
MNVEAIRSGLISAKLNQLDQTIIVTRYTSRVFTNKQWELLKNRLDTWKSNLSDLKQVVTNAKFIAQTQDVANVTPVVTNQ